MRSRNAMDPNLIYLRRHEDVLLSISCCLSSNSGSRNLEAGIKARRMNPIGTKSSFIPLGNSHFTQHSSVVPPQLSKAVVKRTVVDTAFTQSQIIVFSGGLFRASSLDLHEGLLA